MFFEKNVKYAYANTLLEGVFKMALDKVMIGERIRKIREETLNESRKNFAKRCDLTERCVGQIERGDFLLSMTTLDKIAIATGIDTDYILYGKGADDKTKTRNALHTIINRSSKMQVDMYYNCISTMIYYEVNKDKEDNN